MADHQVASVKVVNNTSRTLLSISLSHKYSDVYKNSHTWENIGNNSGTSTSEVDFNTGFWTTGRDWWVLTWVDDQGNTYMTDPNNFRSILDFLEKITNRIAEPLAELATAVAVGSPEPTSKALAAAAAVSGAIAEALLNNESTDGFKQHILREEDTKKPTVITIKDDEVEFSSESGISTTVFKKVN